MSTIICQCGATVSKKATKCPKCGDRLGKAKKQIKCSTCKTTLVKDDHVFISSHDYQVDGTTRTSSYLSQIPCTECGDPTPYRPGEITLLKPLDDLTLLQSLIATVLFIFGFSALVSFCSSP